jgi:hypothetical protein
VANNDTDYERRQAEALEHIDGVLERAVNALERIAANTEFASEDGNATIAIAEAVAKMTDY